MHIVIAGGSGFLGSALARALTREGHDVAILTRQKPNEAPPTASVVRVLDARRQRGPWARAVDGASAVDQSCRAESIAAKRWSVAQKTKLRDSRLLATGSLTAAIRQAPHPPGAFISGSAVGYYGDRGEETLTESSAAGSGLPGQPRKGLGGGCQRRVTTSREWHSSAPASSSTVKGGALPKMLPPFKMFAGGPLGIGHAIHAVDPQGRLGSARGMDDRRRRCARCAERHQAHAPVTNAEFSKALGRALKRPSLLPAPGVRAADCARRDG